MSEAELISRFLAGDRAMIADPNSSSRSRLAKSLCKLGIPLSRISLASTYEEAQKFIETFKPKLILSEFMLGKRSGLDLVPTQKEHFGQLGDSIFCLVTANTSQSTVARAAEEDVDTYILKPYTMNVLNTTLTSAIRAKISPSDYLKNIREGKYHLFEGRHEEALHYFDLAKSLDSTPTLAYFYAGQAKALMSILDDAESNYRAGLTLNRLHYKCLVGLFDLWMREKRHGEAYNVVRKIARYFPANPKRILTVLKLAIETKNYSDINNYYEIFMQLDERSEDLVKYLCSAMCILGKHHLMQKEQEEALKAFSNAAVSCGSQTRFLRYIVEILFEFDLPHLGEPFYKRYRDGMGGGTECQTLQYLTSYKEMSLSKRLETGRLLLRDGVKCPLVYKVLIESTVLAHQRDTSESLVIAAGNLFPDRAAEFKSLLSRSATEPQLAQVA